MAKIKLVTRGDDAGSCEAANLACRESAMRGQLRNISLMVPGPAFDHAVRALADLDHVSIGLHVTLNAEWETVKWGPILGASNVPSLVCEDGFFTRQPVVLHDRGFSLEEAVAEVQAQLDRAREAGFDIRYIDEHMGVGWIRDLRPALRELATREGLPYVEEMVTYLPEVEGLKFESPLDELLTRLERAPEGTYLWVTHPGMDTEDMRAFWHEGLEPGAIARERDAERQMWLDPALDQAQLDGLFTPIRYDEALA